MEIFCSIKHVFVSFVHFNASLLNKSFNYFSLNTYWSQTFEWLWTAPSNFFFFFSEIIHGIKAEKLNRKMKWVKNAAQIPNIKQ